MVENNELRKAGLKVTLPRVKILQMLDSTDQRHMSAEDVYRTLLQQGLDVGMATIYRVLAQFEQAGLLCRNSFDGDKAIYELDEGLHHDHLVCLDCGHVEEFYDAEIEKLQHRIARDKGYRLSEHSLSLYAHCTRTGCPHRDKT